MADGHAAWQALLAWYKGPVMSGEISKTLCSKLWTLRLQTWGDANKHINDFTLYMDQLRGLGREKREEGPTDLFLDSILDPRYAVTIAHGRLRDHISIHECFKAIRKYENIIAREAISEHNHLNTQRTNTQPSKHKEDNMRQAPGNNQGNTPQKGNLHTGYRTYKKRRYCSNDHHYLSCKITTMTITITIMLWGRNGLPSPHRERTVKPAEPAHHQNH
jgi:hypothetical protein